MTLLKPAVGRVVGWAALASLVVLALFGLWGAPPDAVQGDAQRLMYLHVPAAWIAYLAFAVTAAASALWLWTRTRSPVWDRIAGASAELGVVFTALTLVLGSLWGRPVWGVWWAWDARLVTTAVLLFLYLGYLALRTRAGCARDPGEALRDRSAHRVRRRPDRALLGHVVADAAPGGNRLRSGAEGEHPRGHGVHAVVRCARVHARVRRTCSIAGTGSRPSKRISTSVSWSVRSPSGSRGAGRRAARSSAGSASDAAMSDARVRRRRVVDHRRRAARLLALARSPDSPSRAPRPRRMTADSRQRHGDAARCSPSGCVRVAVVGDRGARGRLVRERRLLPHRLGSGRAATRAGRRPLSHRR